MNISRQILRGGALLAFFAILGSALVTLSYQKTQNQIKENERQALLKQLNDLFPSQNYDNNLLDDVIFLDSTTLFGDKKPGTVYRAWHNKQPAAIAFMPVAQDGYSGKIKLLVGIHYDGTLAGVRVLEHKETPGLGDAIDEKRSPWIFQFGGLSLDNPDSEQWKVKRDGGVFDQFTGATITPRAVIKTVHRSLEFFKKNHEVFFEIPQTSATR